MSRTRNRSVPALLPAVALVVLAACSAGNDPATLFREGNFERAFELFSERAAGGDLDAVNHLGIHYYLGAGVERDFEQAVKYFEQAALANHADAQRNLGVMYMRGLGVKLDNRRAYGWLFHAHSGGNGTALNYLRMISDNVTPNAGAAARQTVADLLREHASGAP